MLKLSRGHTMVGTKRLQGIGGLCLFLPLVCVCVCAVNTTSVEQKHMKEYTFHYLFIKQ